MIEGLPDIAPFKERLNQLNRELSDPEVFADNRHAAALSREHQKLSSLLKGFQQLEKLTLQLEEHRGLLEDPGADSDLREIAESEIAGMEERETRLRHEVLGLMIPPEPSDERNIVMEIRGGRVAMKLIFLRGISSACIRAMRKTRDGVWSP